MIPLLTQGMAMKITTCLAQTFHDGPRPNWYTLDIILTFDFPHA
ncbi:hypothetical protein PWG14_09495 (plasmid) [Chromobacterium amazonense]|jgi:hypothetical protein|nr:hypothetical protein [Chromobacterium amazonense]MDE1712880.1 hypothetical protein [Chromobacterium amazonense]